MDVEPPPLKVEEDPKSANEDEDDLFKTVNNQPIGGDASSGYQTRDNSSIQTSVTSMERSDTLEDVKMVTNNSTPEAKPRPVEQNKDNGEELEEEEDLDELFRKAKGLGPEPEKSKIPPAETEIVLDEDEEEDRPFKDAHLNPDLQLSGVPTAILPSTFMDRNPTNQVNGNKEVKNEFDGKILASAVGMKETENPQHTTEDFIEIMVIEPHKVGEGMSSYIAYKVVTKTNANFFRKANYCVIRRFSDFLGLHDKLSEKHLPNGRLIPPAPDKNMVNSTKMKMGNKESGQVEDTNGNPDEFLERRRASLERFLRRIAVHPVLRSDPDFREFVELEAELPKANHTATLSGKNVMKLLNKVGDKMTNMTLRMEETDDWCEEKTATMTQLDSQLRRLHSATETLFEYRRALSSQTGQLARSLAALSECEENQELSGALAQLSSIQGKVETIHREQASADFFYFSELIKDYIGLVSAVKDMFQERIKAWQQWQNITASLTKKREAKVKAELQYRQDRVSVLRQEIADCESQQEMAQENFEKISRIIKKEVELFDMQRCTDFKKNIISYLEAMAKAQDDISMQWEQYLPDIKTGSIPSSDQQSYPKEG